MQKIKNKEFFYIISGYLLWGVIVVIWQFVSTKKIIEPGLLPPPNKVFFAFLKHTLNGNFLDSFKYTGSRILVAFTLAAFINVFLGLILGRSYKLFLFFQPTITFMRVIPPPCFIALIFIFFGTSDLGKIVFILIGVSFPILLNTIDGVRDIHPRLLETAKVFGLNRYEVFFKFILPATSPYIVSGLRVALLQTIALSIFAEYIGSTNGLGNFILRMHSTWKTPDMYAGIFLLAFFGYLINYLFFILTERLMYWHYGRTK